MFLLYFVYDCNNNNNNNKINDDNTDKICSASYADNDNWRYDCFTFAEDESGAWIRQSSSTTLGPGVVTVMTVTKPSGVTDVSIRRHDDDDDDYYC